MKYRVRHRRRDTNNGDFANSPAAESVDVRVGFVDQMHIYLGDVGIYADGVIREIVIDRAAVATEFGDFHQGHAKAHGDAADHLAARGFVVDDAAVVDGAADAGDSAAPSTTAASSTTKPRAAR